MLLLQILMRLTISMIQPYYWLLIYWRKLNGPYFQYYRQCLPRKCFMESTISKFFCTFSKLSIFIVSFFLIFCNFMSTFTYIIPFITIIWYCRQPGTAGSSLALLKGSIFTELIFSFIICKNPSIVFCMYSMSWCFFKTFQLFNWKCFVI